MGGHYVERAWGEHCIIIYHTMYDTIDCTHTTQECDTEKLVQE